MRKSFCFSKQVEEIYEDPSNHYRKGCWHLCWSIMTPELWLWSPNTISGSSPISLASLSLFTFLLRSYIPNTHSAWSWGVDLIRNASCTEFIIPSSRLAAFLFKLIRIISGNDGFIVKIHTWELKKQKQNQASGEEKPQWVRIPEQLWEHKQQDLGCFYSGPHCWPYSAILQGLPDSVLVTEWLVHPTCCASFSLYLIASVNLPLPRLDYRVCSFVALACLAPPSQPDSSSWKCCASCHRQLPPACCPWILLNHSLSTFAVQIGENLIAKHILSCQTTLLVIDQYIWICLGRIQSNQLWPRVGPLGCLSSRVFLQPKFSC